MKARFKKENKAPCSDRSNEVLTFCRFRKLWQADRPTERQTDMSGNILQIFTYVQYTDETFAYMLTLEMIGVLEVTRVSGLLAGFRDIWSKIVFIPSWALSFFKILVVQLKESFLEVQLPYDPVYPCRVVGRSVRHNFLKGREVTLPCSYRSTGTIHNFFLALMRDDCFN